MKPIDVKCPHCGAAPGKLCVTPKGSLLVIRHHRDDTNFHVRRIQLALDTLNPKVVAAGKTLMELDVDVVTTEMTRPLPELAYVSFEKYTKQRLPKKLRYKVRDRHHVWCDHHGAVHPATNDYFDEGSKDCYPLNWRRVYIESDDRTETF